MTPPIVLLKGSDPVLLNDAAIEKMSELVGDRDRNEILDHFSGDDFALSDAIMAASAMSMFGDRIIVVRQAGRFSTDDLVPLMSYVADPNPTSTLVLVWDKPLSSGAKAHPVSKKLTEAIKAAGGSVLDTDVAPNAKLRQGWLDEHLASAAVKFLPATKAYIGERLGEDVARLPGLIRLLESSFEPGAKLTTEDVEPFLATAGSVAPWDLTDAIDKGDVATAVTTLRRMTGAGERHPLQLIATLNTHFGRMLRLDGSGVRDDKAAATLLGMKGSSYPAKKAMEQGRRLGSERVAQAIRLLATADVDLRGATAVPADAVMEVLVARLARLSGSARGRR